MKPGKVVKALTWLWGRTPMPNPWGRDPMLRAIGRYMASRFATPIWFGASICWIFWIPRALLLASKHSLANGRAARTLGAAPVALQWLDQVWQAWRYGRTPDYYYQYRLFDPDERSKAGGYLASHHAAMLCASLDTTSTDFIEDKLGLEEHLASHGVPVVRTLATATNGIVTRKHWSSTELPAQDLILKPNSGMCGRGIQRIRHRDDGNFEIDGSTYTGAEVLQHMQERSMHEAYLLQPCLLNHAQIVPVAPSALSTVRLLTGRKPDGHVQAIIAALRIAPLGSAADNFSAGGWAAPIDLASGQLGPASRMQALTSELLVHPQTGAIVADIQIPDWQAVQDLARQGHRSLPGFVFLAWDLAVTPTGAVVVEVNTTSETVILQKPGLRPLDQTVFAEVARAWLRH